MVLHSKNIHYCLCELCVCLCVQICHLRSIVAKVAGRVKAPQQSVPITHRVCGLPRIVAISGTVAGPEGHPQDSHTINKMSPRQRTKTTAPRPEGKLETQGTNLVLQINKDFSIVH
ncbi:hypothetical protein ATANTOWER_021879 [Ataeniobius toweri]|uniref:Secreted protein n=1 Tax=Ataeniobius toweri TaxID=208326 RepID=A0ABU7AGX3_9TELE|nr:hypothetical protein [Ataeniobius toweri]